MGRTIRTCSLFALAAALTATGAAAKRLDTTALGAYVRARAADKASDPATAAASYAAALTMAPDATMVAFRAYRAGVDSGDYRLALRAAQLLERTGIVPPDARVLLYIAAVRERDWRGAAMQLDEIEGQDGLDFLAPLLRGWLAVATGAKAPDTRTRASAYIAENDLLLGLMRGGSAGGARTLWSTDPYRASTLRLAAAATLVAQKRQSDALAILNGDDPTQAEARAAIAAGKRVPGAVDTPARGTAFVLSRMAGDLMTDSSARSALTLSRLATFADPASPNARLVAATALGLNKRDAEGLALIDSLVGDPVYDDLARGMRIDRLEGAGRLDEALAEASARAGRSVNDLTRLGDIEARRGRNLEAAMHYRRAVELTGADKASAALWLALGNALDLGGDWAGARPALERALALTPDDARLLNQLGYGLASRGEDLPRAVALLRKADAAQPDNAAITDSLGWAQFKRGDLKGAVATLERARALDPAEAEIAEHLGDAYWAVGRRVEARYAWTAAREAAGEGAYARLDGKLDRGLP